MGLCGRFAQSLGLSRSHGTIYGLLYLSPRPIGLQEIADRAHISKGSASMGTRKLLAMGLIQKTWMPKARRDFFEAVPEPADALRTLYNNLIKTRLENSQRHLDNLSSLHAAEKTHLPGQDWKHIDNRLKKLGKLRVKTRRLLPFLEKLL